MAPIDKIKGPIREELKAFEPHFKKTVQSDIPFLGVILNYVLRRKGKQLRPMFVFLSAKLNGEICESTYHAACAIELLHTATLMHDDVVDETYERRGAFSLNALWKNKIAVLVGDYILAKGLLLSIKFEEFTFLKLISRSVEDMSQGEIVQMRKSRKLDIDEETYFDIIKKKTASLMATSAAIGTASVTEDNELIEKMSTIGEYIGMAFQIKDDIFDYHAKGIIGKPTGNDIKERKMTLPLIHVLNKVSSKDRRRIINLVRRKNKNKEKVREIIEFVIANGGIEYAEQKMIEFRDKAISMLNEFPESEARESFIELVNYVVNRNK
ncbi:polyprenyl synthetase family protein [Puteibacter caeruleilacunae]|nr:polyprenyl synthetase family protein [Puteibacter caeruleilacunae]